MEWFPSKILYQTEFVSKVLDGISPVYPPMIELSLTSRCNLNCYWCIDRDVRTKSPGDWDIDILKRRLTEYSQVGTKAVTIEGGGEPTLYPNLQEVVDHISSIGMQSGLITNGTNIIPNSILRKLKWVRVSLDAYDPESYITVKGVDKFEEVLFNISDLCSRKGESVIGVSYVITPASREVGTLLQRLRNVPGLSYVQLKAVTDTDDYIPVNEDTFGWTRRFSTESMDVYLVDCSPGNAGVGCLAHPVTSTVLQNGDVYFCKRLKANPSFSGRETVIGNLITSTVEEVYNSTARESLDILVKSSSFCSSQCPACRLTKYNELLTGMSRRKSSTCDFL